MLTRFARWLPVGLVAAGLTIMGSPREARAVLVLEGTVQVDAQTPIIVYAADNNGTILGTPAAPAGAVILTDTDPAVGRLALAPAPGVIAPGYNVGSSTNFVSKAFGSNNINSTALDITNNTGSTVTTNIAVGDNNFVGPADFVRGSGGGTFTSAANSTYSIFFYNDRDNAQFSNVNAIPGTQVAAHSFTGAEAPGDNTVAFNFGPTPVSDPGNFGMTLQFSFSLVNGGTFVSRGQNEFKGSVIPEPTTFAMALGGLPILGACWLRRRRRQA